MRGQLPGVLFRVFPPRNLEIIDKPMFAPVAVNFTCPVVSNHNLLGSPFTICCKSWGFSPPVLVFCLSLASDYGFRLKFGNVLLLICLGFRIHNFREILAINCQKQNYIDTDMQEIAYAVGIPRKTAEDTLAKVTELEKSPKLLATFQDSNFETPIYNVWTFAKKTNSQSSR